MPDYCSGTPVALLADIGQTCELLDEQQTQPNATSAPNAANMSKSICLVVVN